MMPPSISMPLIKVWQRLGLSMKGPTLSSFEGMVRLNGLPAVEWNVKVISAWILGIMAQGMPKAPLGPIGWISEEMSAFISCRTCRQDCPQRRVYITHSCQPVGHDNVAGTGVNDHRFLCKKAFFQRVAVHQHIRWWKRPGFTLIFWFHNWCP